MGTTRYGVYQVVETNNSKILLGPIEATKKKVVVVQVIEKCHASLLGLYIYLGEGINTSLLNYY
jgi:hypothetical protein